MTCGVWLGKMTYLKLNALLCTDENFSKMEDKDHLRRRTSLADIPIGFVTKFPLKHMYLVFLGVIWRLLLTSLRRDWKYSLSRNTTDATLETLIASIIYIPRKFA